MLSITFLYVLFIGIGIVGVGDFVWRQCHKKIKNEAMDFVPHPFLTLSIVWTLGYFFYEGMLSLLSVTHLFYPVCIKAFGFLLSGGGIFWLVRERKFRFITCLKKENSTLELFILSGLAGFVFFWNIYPTFDVDSLASYFVTLNNFLLNGARTFEHFADVRLSMPLGENLLYAFGFSWDSHSTVFAQLIHGVSKVMLIVGVYGAARSLGLGPLSLLAAAFIASDEHIVASGANFSVHINVQLALTLFLMFFAFFIFLVQKRKEYLFLCLLAALNAVSCKFLGLLYLVVIMFLLALVFMLHKRLRDEAWRVARNPSALMIVGLAVLFLATHYVYSWLTTGSPFFPASIGPLKSPFYDSFSSELGRRFHYGISLSEALKNVTAFMVWPGILPLKILFPLVLLSGAAAAFLQKSSERILKYGLGFSLLSIAMVLLQALYMTFEMRYYRFGIGLYALSCALLMTFLLKCFGEVLKISKNQEKILSLIVVIVVSLYAVRYSFDAMGPQRPSAHNIMDFIRGEKTEYQIIDEYYPQIKEKANRLRLLNLPQNELGVLVDSHWPHVYYPVAGYHLGPVQTAAVPTAAYFDEGWMADEFKRKGIRYIFNDDHIAKMNDPWTGRIYNLLQDCGRPLQKEEKDILELSLPCLDKWIAKKDGDTARRRLDAAMQDIRSQERYVPFNIPPFGGFSGIYR